MIPFLINAFILFYTVHPPNASKHYDSFTIPFTFSAMGCIQSMVSEAFLTISFLLLDFSYGFNLVSMAAVERLDEQPDNVRGYENGNGSIAKKQQ